jgi:G3E family GTPase
MTNLTAPKPNTLLDIPKTGMPVTIITGFLGSGKTTLLNYILQNCQNLKVAVLVNEFGDINIDSQLLVSVDENMMELTNGCICCTINDGLLDAVYSVLERNDRIDYLVVETTGIADPLPIALTFLGTELRDLTRLDAILTLVDVETFTEDHFESDAALNQISYGDIILLNKTDLVSETKVNELENVIRDIKAGARILRSQYGKVPLPLILDVGFSQPELFAFAKESSHHHHHDEHHHHHHSDHLANDGFMSVSFQSDRPFSVVKFQKFLELDLNENIFRAKGIIWFKESNLRHIFQLSGKRIELQTDQWQQKHSNQLVFIGRNLNAAQLQEQLTNCLT